MIINSTTAATYVLLAAQNAVGDLALSYDLGTVLGTMCIDGTAVATHMLIALECTSRNFAVRITHKYAVRNSNEIEHGCHYETVMCV